MDPAPQEQEARQARSFNWFRELFKSGSIARNAVTLGAYTALSQLIAIAFLPIITRVYSPADFGIYSIYSGIFAFLTILVCGRYELAIVLPKTDGRARLILLLCFMLTAAWSIIFLLVSVAVIFIAPDNDLVAYLPFVALSILASGIKIAATYWLVRGKRFRVLGLIEILGAASLVSVQVLLGALLGSHWMHLIASHIASQAIMAAACLIVYGYSFIDLPQHQNLLRRFLVIARSYKQFPLFSVPAGIMNNLGYQSLVLIMPIYFSTTIVGHVGLGVRATRAPIGLVSGALSRVLVQRMAHNYANGISNVPIIVMSVRWLLLLGLLAAIPLSIYAPALFALVFGEEWRDSGTFAALLLPMVVGSLCMNSVSQMYVYNKNHIGFIWQATFGIVLALVLFVGGEMQDAYFAISVYSWIAAVLYFVHIALTLKFAGGNLGDFFRLRSHFKTESRLGKLP